MVEVSSGWMEELSVGLVSELVWVMSGREVTLETGSASTVTAWVALLPGLILGAVSVSAVAVWGVPDADITVCIASVLEITG